MMIPTIIAIVEGDGEVQAAPILIRRIAAAFIPGFAVQVPTPIKVNRDRLISAGELERYVDLAACQSGPNGGILIMLDADDDCPRDLAPEIFRRAKAARADRRIGVVLASREYEAWFLAAAESLAGHRDVSGDITAPANPESIRNAKGWLGNRMQSGKAYKETRHQPAFSTLFDLDQARRGAPSFDKMWRTVADLTGHGTGSH